MSNDTFHTAQALAAFSASDLEAILLTVDGRGREVKRQALHELIRRATEGGRFDYDLMQELKRP